MKNLLKIYIVAALAISVVWPSTADAQAVRRVKSITYGINRLDFIYNDQAVLAKIDHYNDGQLQMRYTYVYADGKLYGVALNGSLDVIMKETTDYDVLVKIKQGGTNMQYTYYTDAHNRLYKQESDILTTTITWENGNPVFVSSVDATNTFGDIKNMPTNFDITNFISGAPMYEWYMCSYPWGQSATLLTKCSNGMTTTAYTYELDERGYITKANATVIESEFGDNDSTDFFVTYCD